VGTLNKIFKTIEQAGEIKGSGFGVDVTDLVGADLLNPEKGVYILNGIGGHGGHLEGMDV
jgi:hypothetical protein